MLHSSRSKSKKTKKSTNTIIDDIFDQAQASPNNAKQQNYDEEEPYYNQEPEDESSRQPSRQRHTEARVTTTPTSTPKQPKPIPLLYTDTIAGLQPGQWFDGFLPEHELKTDSSSQLNSLQSMIKKLSNPKDINEWISNVHSVLDIYGTNLTEKEILIILYSKITDRALSVLPNFIIQNSTLADLFSQLHQSCTQYHTLHQRVKELTLMTCQSDTDVPRFVTQFIKAANGLDELISTAGQAILLTNALPKLCREAVLHLQAPDQFDVKAVSHTAIKVFSQRWANNDDPKPPSALPNRLAGRITFPKTSHQQKSQQGNKTNPNQGQQQKRKADPDADNSTQVNKLQREPIPIERVQQIKEAKGCLVCNNFEHITYKCPNYKKAKKQGNA